MSYNFYDNNIVPYNTEPFYPNNTVTTDYTSGTATVNTPAPKMNTPSYVAPTPYERGTYTAPVYDEQRVRDLAQTSGAATMRGLRSAMQKVTGGSYANPNVKRMTLRDALAGYGQGVQAAMSGATDTARNLYNTEYTGKVNETQMNFNAGEQAKATNYATAQQAAQMKYQGELNKATAEYKTMWDNYNASQDRLLKSQLTTASGGNRTSVNYGIPYETEMAARGFRQPLVDYYGNPQ